MKKSRNHKIEDIVAPKSPKPKNNIDLFFEEWETELNELKQRITTIEKQLKIVSRQKVELCDPDAPLDY